MSFKLITVCGSATLALLLIEGIVRVIGLAPPLPEQYRDYIEDPCLPFRKKPNVVRQAWSASGEFNFETRTNSQGFRDREHTFAKRDGVFRILALGDSFTWGTGAPYEDTFLYRLEHYLNSRGEGHQTVEIINTGVPRYFPKIQRLLLEHYGLRYEPDLVMAVFVPNDIGDTALGIDALKPSSKEGFLLSQRAQQLGRPGTWLYIHYRTARVLVGGYFSRAESSKGKTEQRRVTDEDLEKALVTVADEYKRMQDIATSSEARFVLVHIPQDDLSPTAGARLRSLVGDKVDVFIDVLPYMAAVQTQTGRGLYWPKDRHPNSDGYEVVARALARELTGRRLVPSREMSFLGQR